MTPSAVPGWGPSLYWVCRIASQLRPRFNSAWRRTRRRSPDAPDGSWHIYFGDMRVGTIAIRTGMGPLAKIRGAGPVASIRLAAGR